MQTNLKTDLLKTDKGQRIDTILRKCVHCGFCLATCPTYQLLGDELDSPRGRIYQIKQVFEGHKADSNTQLHLDRCLTCRSCETTCPSGVNYAELLDYGREEVNATVDRNLKQKTLLSALNTFLPYPNRHKLAFKTLSLLKPVLPSALSHKIPSIRPVKSYPSKVQPTTKHVYLLEGCVQSTISPNTNQAAVSVLNRMGYKVTREQTAECCGALSHHSGKEENTLLFIKNQLKKWAALNQQSPIDAIVSTASGCGVMLKDYERLIAKTDQEKYKDILSKIVDISELLNINALKSSLNPSKESIAYHAPCTLNHGQRLADALKVKLLKLGYQIKEPKDAHLCCGSAGTYSILQSDLSKQLKSNKLEALEATKASFIITANVGCEHHLSGSKTLEVKHWIELIAENLV